MNKILVEIKEHFRFAGTCRGAANIWFFISILYFVASLYWLYRKDYDGSLLMFVLGVIFITLSLYLYKESIKTNEFILWLKDNKKKLKEFHTILYKNTPISIKKEIVRYKITISLLIISTISYSRFIITEEDKKNNIVCTTISFVFGWWAILGPVFNLLSLFTNLKGGKSFRIEEIIDEFCFEETKQE